MSPERRDATIRGAALGILLVGLAFTGGWAARPAEVREPETWCPKRFMGFFLYGEKLELNTVTQDGLLTCRYLKEGAKDDIGREVEAKGGVAVPKKAN